ncbi:hypothetical protein ES708_17043 [subsurface metagenome]
MGKAGSSGGDDKDGDYSSADMGVGMPDGVQQGKHDQTTVREGHALADCLLWVWWRGKVTAG